jgi:hypothetical protein
LELSLISLDGLRDKQGVLDIKSLVRDGGKGGTVSEESEGSANTEPLNHGVDLVLGSTRNGTKTTPCQMGGGGWSVERGGIGEVGVRAKGIG